MAIEWKSVGTNVTREIKIVDTMAGNRYVWRLQPHESVTVEAENVSATDAAAIVANGRAGGTATVSVLGVSISGSVTGAVAKKNAFGSYWQVTQTLNGESFS